MTYEILVKVSGGAVKELRRSSFSGISGELERQTLKELEEYFAGERREFDVPVDMYYEDPSQGLSIDLEKGLQKLDGESAMGLVRYRYGYADADIGVINELPPGDYILCFHTNVLGPYSVEAGRYTFTNEYTIYKVTLE